MYSIRVSKKGKRIHPEANLKLKLCNATWISHNILQIRSVSIDTVLRLRKRLSELAMGY